MRARAILLALGLLAMGGCEAQPPDVDNPGGGLADAGAPSYADLVVSFTEAGVPTTCTETTTTICETQVGICAGHPVLGAPDGITQQLQPNDLIEVGFNCNPIIDRSTDSDFLPDFQIHATIESGTGAVVSVSEDGSVFRVLDILRSDNQVFHLTNERLDYVRFIRIAAEADTVLSVDAVEGL